MYNHQATEQMIDYLYQVRYALALLLNNENEKFQISLEKFDDVAFSKDDVPKQLIQLKHHVRRHGNLTDRSTDLWRTLKVWIDAIKRYPITNAYFVAKSIGLSFNSVSKALHMLQEHGIIVQSGDRRIVVKWAES